MNSSSEIISLSPQDSSLTHQLVEAVEQDPDINYIRSAGVCGEVVRIVAHSALDQALDELNISNNIQPSRSLTAH